MKRKIVGIFIFCLVLCLLFYVYHTKKNSWPDFVSNSSTDDSVLHNLANENSQSQEFENTGFIWKESKGDEYPIYMAHTGSCFIIKTSESGEDYRAYLDEEVSEQIFKELSNRKKSDNVGHDTIYSFLGKPIVINNKIYEQISAIATQDKMLLYSDSIIQIGDVRWRVNLMPNGIALMTSVQPDDPKMKQVVKYLNSIYGKPYQEDEDGNSIKWSSSDDSLDIFKPGNTLVHLRRVHSEEGTIMFFK